MKPTDWVNCPKCTSAVLRRNLDQHLAEKRCPKPPKLPKLVEERAPSRRRVKARRKAEPKARREADAAFVKRVQAQKQHDSTLLGLHWNELTKRAWKEVNKKKRGRRKAVVWSSAFETNRSRH